MDETFWGQSVGLFVKGVRGGGTPFAENLQIGIWNLPLVITQVQVSCLAGLGRRGEAGGAVRRGG